MNVKINTRQVDGVTIIDVSGRMTQAGGSAVLREVVRELIGKGEMRILLNLADVTYIDSSGIGDIVNAWKSTRERGGKLILLRPTKMIRDLLEMSKLYALFDVMDDEAIAIRSIAS